MCLSNTFCLCCTQIRIVNYKRITMVSLALTILAIIGYLKFDFFWRQAHNPMIYFAVCLVRVSHRLPSIALVLSSRTPLEPIFTHY